ncbi:hypothetical protein [Corynebacterium aquilae]|uniref:hypothetical protein n=1 Tax=Corynebacterium aquilae TaxID=203263 RepID=UPI0009516C89|nr:hypothetical protein [Corynebacterium aquilae]
MSPSRPSYARRLIIAAAFLAPTLGGAIATHVTHQEIHTTWNTNPEHAVAAPSPLATDSTQLVDARRAAGQAASQAGFLTTGTNELNEGLKQLNDKTEELANGITELDDGAKQLNEGLVQLQAGTGQLGDGAVRIADGVSNAVEQVQGLTMIQAQVIGAVDNIDQQLAQSRDPRAPEWRKQLAQLRTEAAKLGINGDMADQLDQLRSGTRDLANQLAVPGYAYHDGIYKAAEGTKKLTQGTKQLNEGTAEAIDGIGKLAEGGEKVNQMAQRTSDDVDAVARALPAPAPIAATGADAAEPDAPARALSPLIAFLITALVSLGGVSLFAIARPWTWSRINRFGLTPTIVGTAAVGAVGVATLIATTSTLDPTGIVLAALVTFAAAIVATLAGRATISLFGPTLGRVILFISLILQIAIVGHVWTGTATSDTTTAWAIATSLMPINYPVEALVTVGNNGETMHLVIALAVMVATALLAGLAGRFVRVPVDEYGFAEEQGVADEDYDQA